MKKLMILAVMILVPAVANATSYTDKLRDIKFGYDSQRNSSGVFASHSTACLNNPCYYTFTGKPAWLQGMLLALQLDATVTINGTNNAPTGSRKSLAFKL